MEDLLDLCLSEEDSDIGNRAFMVFTRTNQKLIQAFLKDDTFYSHASAVIFRDSPSIRSISRVATLLTNMITAFPEKSEECCGFIFKLIEFCDEPGVYDLIHKICEPSSTLYKIQEGLVEARFSDVIIQELKDENTVPHKILALLRAVREASENEIMRSSVQTIEMIKVIENLMHHEELNLKNELWGTLVAVMCQKNRDSAKAFIRAAADNVIEFYERVMRYHVSSFEFLEKMINLRSQDVKEVLGSQMDQAVVRLIVQFADSSNLMGAVFRFIKAGIRWRELTRRTLTVYVPLMAHEAVAKARTAASAQCMVLLDELERHSRREKELAEALATMDVFAEFCGGGLRWYRKVMSSSYGGSVEKKIGKSPSSYFL